MFFFTNCHFFFSNQRSVLVLATALKRINK
jgi:hypothetical protein